MSYQTPITIREALEKIQAQEFVLPAIQREFVWSAPQVISLFDSLMRGYPIGSFLFWRLEPESTGAKSRQDQQFYGFLKDMHDRDSFHSPKLDVPASRPVTAILDGQQRLTALNIGLRGSWSWKIDRKRWNNPNAFPHRTLHLNLAQKAEEDNEEGWYYDFWFPTDKEAASADYRHWIPVSQVLEWKPDDFPQIHKWLNTHGLADNEFASSTLYKLVQTVHSAKVVMFFEETIQDVDRVLDIFIKVNAGGTKLSYSDLLLSMSTAQWKEVDAREAIHGMVDDLNHNGEFDFSKDLVLKAGLMLTDVPDVGFKLKNFTKPNTAKIEKDWENIRQALLLGRSLLRSFGFRRETLGSDSVLLPIAYYLRLRELDDSYLNRISERDDRDHIRAWVLRSLLKRGVWGSGLDSLLRRLREVIKRRGTESFPHEELEAAMATLGKSLEIGEEELDDIASLRYGEPRAYVALSFLYPHETGDAQIHVDHVIPKTRLSQSAARKAGVSESERNWLEQHRDDLANLQPLSEAENTSKSGKGTSDWLAERFQSASALKVMAASRHLVDVPDTAKGARQFLERRRELQIERLRELLNVSESTKDED
jgi:hypothetical protein